MKATQTQDVKQPLALDEPVTRKDRLNGTLLGLGMGVLSAAMVT